MTFTRMLDWHGGPPSEAAAAFDAALDAAPPRPNVAAQRMSKDEKRAALAAGIKARGETPRLT